MQLPRRFLIFALLLVSCATGSTTKSSNPDDPGSAPLFVTPRNWEVVDEREGEKLYQANLRNNRGAGRMLIGRLRLKGDIQEPESYLYKLHNDLVERIRGETSIDPFAQERLGWANGLVGYRTKMRGELDRKVIIIEGVTLSDGEYAYFHYGLFPENVYEEERVAYGEVLRNLGPIRGAQQEKNRGLEIAGKSDVVSSDVGSDGAESPAAYQSPATHLGVAPWGATRADILADAGLPLREGENAVGYSCQFLAAKDCVVVYLFEFGRLTHGGLLFEANFESPQDYVARYLRMTKRLTEKYGRPRQSAAIWSDTTYKEQGSRWGEALAAGQVIFGTVWEIGPSKLVHSLRMDDDGNIEHRVLISNDELREQLRQESSSS